MGAQWSVKSFTLWLCVETSHRCAFSNAFIMCSLLKNCLTFYLPPNFLTAQYVTSLYTIHTTWIRGTLLLCGFVGNKQKQMWNGLPAALCPGPYDMGSFIKRVISTWKATCSSSGVARGSRRRRSLTIYAYARLPCLLNLKNHILYK